MSELGTLEITGVGDPRAGRTELSIAGEVDLATCPDLRRALSDAMDAGARELILDMAAVGLIDATGIGVLVSASNRARQAGGGITLRSPSEAVRRVLGAVDLDGVLRVEP